MTQYTSERLRVATYSNGQTGKGISKIDNYYYAYTSDTKGEGFPDTSSNMWKTNISELAKPFDKDNKYLWNFERITYTEGDPTDTDATMIAIYSSDGRGITGVYEFFILTKTSSPPELVPTMENSNGWTPNGDGTIPVPNAGKPFLWNYEIVDYTEGDDTGSGPVCIGQYGNSIAEVKEWYMATETSSEPTNQNGTEGGWVSEITGTGHCATKPYLWNYEETTYSAADPVKSPITLLTASPRTIKTITEYYQQLPVTSDDPNGVVWKAGDDKHIQSPDIPAGWSTTRGELDQGKYMWNLEVIEFQAVDAEGKNLYTATVPAIAGYAGVDGASAKDFNITATSYAFVKAKEEDTTYKNSITLTAHKLNLGDATVYWQKKEGENFVNIQENGENVTGNTYTPMGPGIYRGVIYKSDNTTIEWSDEVVLVETVDGATGKNAISIVLSNPTMVFHGNTDGESENCEVIVYEGGAQLTYGENNTNGTFKVTKADEQSAVENVILQNEIITISDKVENGSYKITVSVKTSTGETSSQNFTISWKVVYDGENGEGVWILYHDAVNGNDTLNGPTFKDYNVYNTPQSDGWYQVQTDNSVYMTQKTGKIDKQAEIDWGGITRISGTLTNYADLYNALDGIEKDNSGIYQLGDGYIGINADIIQTGALRVGTASDEAGKPWKNAKFYADIDDNSGVYVGGWQVTENSVVDKDDQIGLYSQDTMPFNDTYARIMAGSKTTSFETETVTTDEFIDSVKAPYSKTPYSATVKNYQLNNITLPMSVEYEIDYEGFWDYKEISVEGSAEQLDLSDFNINDEWAIVVKYKSSSDSANESLKGFLCPEFNYIDNIMSLGTDDSEKYYIKFNSTAPFDAGMWIIYYVSPSYGIYNIENNKIHKHPVLSSLFSSWEEDAIELIFNSSTRSDFIIDDAEDILGQIYDASYLIYDYKNFSAELVKWSSTHDDLITCYFNITIPSLSIKNKTKDNSFEDYKLNSNDLINIANTIDLSRGKVWGQGLVLQDTENNSTKLELEISYKIITNIQAPFVITKNGHLYATGGKIGGWEIDEIAPASDEIGILKRSKNQDTGITYTTGMAAKGDGLSVAFWAGCQGGTPWEVTDYDKHTGFFVTEDGKLHATDAYITGIINAQNGGTIGGWSLSETTSGVTTITNDSSVDYGEIYNYTNGKIKLSSNGLLFLGAGYGNSGRRTAINSRIAIYNTNNSAATVIDSGNIYLYDQNGSQGEINAGSDGWVYIKSKINTGDIDCADITSHSIGSFEGGIGPVIACSDGSNRRILEIVLNPGRIATVYFCGQKFGEFNY